MILLLETSYRIKRSMEELITIIIPIYNGQRHIKHMVDMIKAQTYVNLEILIVNDGSTDDTAALCEKYIDADKRFKLLCKENEGVSVARNYGVEHAAGQYIAFIDVDDYVYPEYIQKLFYLIKKYGADWSQCSFIKVSDTYNAEKYEKYRKKTYLGKGEFVFNREEAIFDFGYRKHLGGYSYLKLIKKDLAKRLSFNKELKYGEDYMYVYEMLKISQKIAYIDSVEYLYVQNNDSATHQTKNRIQDYYKTWKQLNLIREEVKSLFPYAEGGFLEKCYIQAIKDTTRIADRKKYTPHLMELYTFIKENGKKVFIDPNNRGINRLLGLVGFISPRILCGLCHILVSKGFCFKRTA